MPLIKAFDEATDSTLQLSQRMNGSIHRCILVPHRGSVLCGFTYLDCLNWRRLAAIEENALAVFDGIANENNAFTTTAVENLLIVVYRKNKIILFVFFTRSCLKFTTALLYHQHNAVCIVFLERSFEICDGRHPVSPQIRPFPG